MHEIGRIINMKDGGPRGTIYQGDMTSHGGVVVGASGHMMKADGKLNARVGDMVTYPRCKPHLFPIVSIQWLPWPLDAYNFSDLASSTKILFWEIK